MFIVHQKREEIRAVEKDNRREEEEKKKKEEEDLIGDVNVVATCCTRVCSNHAFLLFFLLVFIPAEFLFSSRNVRYTPVWPVLSDIGRYLERYILKVFQYRFINLYEEFRPYRPVQYGIDFFDFYDLKQFKYSNIIHILNNLL